MKLASSNFYLLYFFFLDECDRVDKTILASLSIVEMKPEEVMKLFPNRCLYTHKHKTYRRVLVTVCASTLQPLNILNPYVILVS